MRFLSSIFALVWAVIKSFIIVAAVFVLLALALVPDADAQTPPECPAGAADCQGASLPFDAPGADESWFYNPNTGQIYFFRSTGLTFALVAIFFALMIVAYFRFTGLRFLDLVGERFDLPPGYQEERMANPEDVPWTSQADGAVRSEYHKAAAEEAKEFARWRQEVKDLFGDDIHFDSFAEARRHKEESEAYYYGAPGSGVNRHGYSEFSSTGNDFGGGSDPYGENARAAAKAEAEAEEVYYHGYDDTAPLSKPSAPLHGTDFGGGSDPYGENARAAARAEQEAADIYHRGYDDTDYPPPPRPQATGPDIAPVDNTLAVDRDRAARVEEEAAAEAADVYNRGYDDTAPTPDNQPPRGGGRWISDLHLKSRLRLVPVGTSAADVLYDDYSRIE